MPKKTKASSEQDVIYARMHNPDVMRWVYGIMLETKQPMREVVERALEYARASKKFSVPLHVTTAEKMAATQKEKEERIRTRAAGGE